MIKLGVWVMTIDQAYDVYNLMSTLQLCHENFSIPMTQVQFNGII